jgi:hypothetical protein
MPFLTDLKSTFRFVLLIALLTFSIVSGDASRLARLLAIAVRFLSESTSNVRGIASLLDVVRTI